MRTPADDQRLSPGTAASAAVLSPEDLGEADKEMRSFRESIVTRGHTALFVAEAAAILLRLDQVIGRVPAMICVVVLLVYNLVTFGTPALSAASLPAPVLLTLDALGVAALTGVTGGIDSPFAGLFFLVTLVGAIYYDLAGGLAVAAGASCALLLSSAAYPSIWHAVITDHIRTQIVPLLLLQGGMAGYLVRYLKEVHQRRIEFEERLRRAGYEAQLRQREVEIAREVQLATLAPPASHRFFEVAVRFQPAGEVGGDFYSCFATEDRMGIVAGDVSGKGIPAALVSTSICHLIRWLSPMEQPERFLRALNTDLYEQIPEWAFATMAFVIVEAQPPRVTIYNAGHPPPLLVSGEGLRDIEPPYPPLGVLPEMTITPQALPLTGSDTLLIYSDGFLEVRNSAGEMLSMEGFVEVVRRHTALPPEQLADRVIEAVSAFGTITDDLTLVVVRLRSLQDEPRPLAE